MRERSPGSGPPMCPMRRPCGHDGNPSLLCETESSRAGRRHPLSRNEPEPRADRSCGKSPSDCCCARQRCLGPAIFGERHADLRRLARLGFSQRLARHRSALNVRVRAIFMRAPLATTLRLGLGGDQGGSPQSPDGLQPFALATGRLAMTCRAHRLLPLPAEWIRPHTTRPRRSCE